MEKEMMRFSFDTKVLLIGLLPSSLRDLWQRISNSPLGYRLAHGAFWAFAGTLFSRGLNLAAILLVARMLGKEGFVEFGIIQNTVNMFQTFAGLGLGWAATKFVAEYRTSDPAKAGRIIALSNLSALGTGVFMALLLYMLGPWLAYRTLAAPHLGGMLQVSALMLFLSTLTSTQNGAMAGMEAFRTIALISLISGIMAFPLIIGGAYVLGLEGAVWGMVALQG